MKQLDKRVRRLKKALEDRLRSAGALSQNHTIEVHYFDLKDLVRYYDETEAAAKKMIEIRDLMENAYFGRYSDKGYRDMGTET